MSLFSLIRGYTHHWLNAVNQHSLHAPFAYDFYVNTLAAEEEQDDFREIEQHRRDYLQNHEMIQVNSPGAPSRVSQNKSRKISNIAGKGISGARNSRLLYRIGKSLQPKTMIELGTSLGINTLYLSASCPGATVYTFEGCPATAEVARSLFKKWHYPNIRLVEGNIDDTLSQTLTNIDTVDFAYLDANHQYAPTLKYYEWLQAKSSRDSIFVLDDIYWSPGMEKAWQLIRQKAEVSLSLDLFELGILFFRELQVKQHHCLMY